MKTILQQLFTHKDNETFDLSRILWALAVLEFLGLFIFTVVFKSQPWTPQDYGIGLGAVLAAGGAGTLMAQPK